MKALLLIAHGSRRKESNDEVFVLAEKLKAQYAQSGDQQYDIFQTGFLEISTPSIDKGIEHCIDEGATSIVVLPYFLNSGRHVINDIPTIVSNTQLQFPDIQIQVAPHIGSSPLMMQLLIECANSVA